jgi:hypothetical protein
MIMMWRLLTMLLVIGWLAGAGALAADQPPTGAPVYKPPARGAPASRIGGGTRRPIALPLVIVLAPGHVAHAAADAPTLYWYLSKKAPVRFELIVMNAADSRTVFEQVLESTMRPGVQALSLKDAGVRLKPGIEYQWRVTMLHVADEQPADLTAAASIQFVPPSAAVADMLSQSSEAARPAVYADAGYWYDCLNSLVQLGRQSPGDARYAKQVDAVLKQIGLELPAADIKSP